MEIRQAILKAADWMENDPHLFDFHKTRVPACGSPGCAVGLIACAAGLEVGKNIDHVPGQTATTFLGLSRHYEFYYRMDELGCPGWTQDAAMCAKGMRLYADKYYPAAKPLDWEALSKPNAAVMATVS